MMSDPAPVEIGNLVWEDSDGDGVQDADEAGIPGVTVELLDAGGAVLATATTDANGNYIFSNDPNGPAFTAGDSHVYQLTSLNSSTAYTVRIPNPSGQAPIGTYVLTDTNTGEGGNPDINDNDAISVGVNADAGVLDTDIPFSGANNHSFDFGFSCPDPSCGTVTVIKN